MLFDLLEMKLHVSLQKLQKQKLNIKNHYEYRAKIFETVNKMN